MANKKYYWSWSDLPQELLELIMARLTTAFDLLRCRSVCHSWRYAALRVISSRDINNSSGITPLLLLYSGEPLCNHNHSKLLCLGENTMEYRYRGPNMKRLQYKDWYSSKRYFPSLNKADDADIEEAADDRGSAAVPKLTMCRATYGGWLLLFPFFYERVLYLFNPLSRMVVQLPPLPKPAMIKDPKKLKFIITSSIPTDPTCMVYLSTTIPPDMAICTPGDKEWTAIYTPGDKEWTPVFTRNYYCVSLLFYQGKFYSLDKLGVLRRSLFDKSHSSYEEEKVCNGNGTINPYRYLVESWSGELLMIVRNLESYGNRRRTKFFEIFKFNGSNCKWKEVRNFSNHQALFLACNDSKFVSVKYNPNYRPNSIYFIEETKPHNKDFGVYNLTTSKVEPLNLSHQLMQRYPYSRWFQPVL